MRKQLLVGLVLLSTAACDRKPEGQTIAIVNGEEITTSELNAELSNVNIPNNAERGEVTNRILQQLVDRRLLAAQAREEGIDKTPEFIARERRMTEDLLIGMWSDRQMNASKLPTAAEIAAFQQRQPQAFANRQVWRLNQVQYETPTDAAVRNRILQTKTLDELTAVLTQARIPFQRATNQLVTSVIPADLYPRLVGLAPGEPFIVPNGNRSVASVIVERQPAPLEGAAARTEAVNMIRRQTTTKTLEDRLKALRAAAQIEYQQGYAAPKQ